MTVFKLITCSWTHLISNNESRRVRYYLLYKREYPDQIQNDELDEAIKSALEAQFTNPLVSDFIIKSEEKVFFTEQSAERSKSELLVSLPSGGQEKELIINANACKSMLTKVFFSDIEIEAIASPVLNFLPYALNLTIENSLETLSQTPFMTRETIERILGINNDNEEDL